ncbi:MAG TPA: TetR/AcrR family transcriptional regulator, partial [Nannocystaceae bacterium]|nr:TetR/AcrR family transcriptional regulator [Nannocystaceae bacterium]
QTAARLFSERGYTAVGVAEICDEAGLKKGSFYHFFETKLDLVLESIDCYARGYDEAIGRALVRTDKPAREQIVDVLQAVHGMLSRGTCEDGKMRGCPIGNLALELAHREEAIRYKIDSVFARWRGAFEMILRRGVEQGELDIPDPARTAETIVALMQGATLLAKTANDADVFARVVESVLGIVPSRRSTPAVAPPTALAPA